jgi:hypothetical protein
MRQRYLVGIKLAETVFRGLFVLICTYKLPLESAGRFGLYVALVSLCVFGLGFERYIDTQRQVAGLSPSAVRQRMADTLKFFFTQYCGGLLLLGLSVLLLDIPVRTAGLFMAAVVGEHISTQAYLAVLIAPRTYPLLLAVTAKNALQLLAVLYPLWQGGTYLVPQYVYEIWATASIGLTLFAALGWWMWARRSMPLSGDELPQQAVVQQYHASAYHFLIGLVGVAMLQMDRLVVGITLPAADTGIYFRHIALGGLALQVFNIASYTRVAPHVFQLGRGLAWTRASEVVTTEYRRFALFIIATAGLSLFANQLMGDLVQRFHLEPSLLWFVTVGVLFRASADYQGLLLLAAKCDRLLLCNQIATVAIGTACVLFLSWSFKLHGAFVGAMLASMVYFFLNRKFAMTHYRQLESAPQ